MLAKVGDFAVHAVVWLVYLGVCCAVGFGVPWLASLAGKLAAWAYDHPREGIEGAVFFATAGALYWLVWRGFVYINSTRPE